MTVKTLELSLGSLDASVSPAAVTPATLAQTGWYKDAAGVYYYYDADIAQWYIYSAGYIYPLAYVPPSMLWQPSPTPKVDINDGDTLRLNLTYRYRGPSGKGFTLYAVLCNNTKSGEPAEWSGFASTKPLYPAGSTSWRIISDTLDIVMGSGIMTHSGEDGAVYFKIENYRSPAYYDAIHIVSAVGEFSELSIVNFVKV